MIDALLYAVRDAIRAANIGYGYAECEIMDDGHPPPRCGNWFIAVHDGESKSSRDNTLFEEFSFSITVTARCGSVSIDRIGDQLIARNVSRTRGVNREGFNLKVEQLRAFLHMNWGVVVLANQIPPSANDNIANWGTGVTYGFTEPMRYRNSGRIEATPPGWFGEEPEGEVFGIKTEMHFDGAKRFQPFTTSPVGPFL